MSTLLVSLLWGSPSWLCLLMLEFQSGHQTQHTWQVCGFLGSECGSSHLLSTCFSHRVVSSHPQRGFLEPSSNNGFTVYSWVCTQPSLGEFGLSWNPKSGPWVKVPFISLEQRFSTFPMLRPFNTVPLVEVTPIIKLFSCCFITIILLLLWITM